MTMSMSRAFNAKMLSKHTRYSVAAGAYDENNEWVVGDSVESVIFGVNRTGNKFSQFDEGVAKHSTDAGVRYSNYRTLFIDLSKFTLELGDMVEYRGIYYNILQMSPEDAFSFRSFLLEENKTWVPSVPEPVTPP